jgi:mannosyltransferase OCH1-like enzyme
MIPKLIHQTSASKDISFEERQLQKRFRRFLPDWELKLWDDADNANLVLRTFPAYYSAYNKLRRGVAKADIARIIYMYVYGGFYFDTDYKLLKGIGDDILQKTCVLPISRHNDPGSPEFRVCNSVFGSTPTYHFWKDFVCHIFENQDVELVDEYNIEKITGPEGLTKFYVENQNRYPEIYLPKRNSFHPLITYKGLFYEKGHSSYGAHLCWGSWRTKNLAKKIKTMAVRKITCF